jgi:hypothetical protein
MPWGYKTITRKFLKYAQGYVSWGTFMEVDRPVPKSTAVRVIAPLFEMEVFLHQRVWCIARPYELEYATLNTEPRPFAPLDAYEADVAIGVAHQYLVHLALELGADNEQLVPASFALRRAMIADDGRTLERRQAFVAVCQYLHSVASGLDHRERRTILAAAGLFEIARPTLQEFAARPPVAPATRAMTVPDAHTKSDSSRDPEDVGEDEDEAWADEIDETDLDEIYADLREAFDAQPVARLAADLGIRVQIPSPRDDPLFFADGDGLNIGNVRDVVVALNGDEDSWTITTFEGSYASGWTTLSGWTIAPVTMHPADVARMTAAALRNLTDRTEGAERNSLLAALIAWGALTGRADDTLWAGAQIRASSDPEAKMPSMANLAARTLIDSPSTSASQVAELRTSFDLDDAS